MPSDLWGYWSYRKLVDLERALVVYAELRHRTILRPAALPPVVVQLNNTCPLTKDEVEYALSVVFWFSGVVVIDDGDHFVQVVRNAQSRTVKTSAPKRSAGAQLIEPANIPTIGGPPGVKYDRPRRGADRLLSFYAELAGKEVVSSGKAPDLGAAFLVFAVVTPVTKEEPQDKHPQGPWADRRISSSILRQPRQQPSISGPAICCCGAIK